MFAGVAGGGAMDLVDLARRPFADVAPAISGSVVYMDEGAGECAHHCAGAGFILSLGAVNVLSLERVAGTVAEATPPVDVAGLPVDPRTPVVIFTTRLLQRSKGDLLRCVGSHPGAASVTVLCAVSEEAHVAAAHAVATASGDPHAAQASGQSYERLVRDLKLAASAIMATEHATKSAPATKSPKKTGRTPKKPARRADDDFNDDGWGDDAGGDGWGDDWGETESEQSEEDEGSELDRTLDGGARGSPSFDVRYFPMPLTPLSRGAFVMPAAGAAASAAVAPPAAYRGAGSHPRSLSLTLPSPDDGGDEDGAHAPVPPGVAVLANQLCAMGAHMGVRLECFALGRTSRAVARATAAAAAPEAGAHPPPAGTAALVLVDRTADMLTPAVHDGGFLHRAVMMDRESQGLGFREEGLGGARTGTGTGPNGEADADGIGSGGLDPALPTAAARTPDDSTPGDFSRPGSVDGVLAHPRDVEACSRLATVHARSAEDAAIETKKWLRDATNLERVEPPGSSFGSFAGGSVASAELAAFAAPLAKDPKLNARHRALLELAAAVASALPGRSPRVDGVCERRDACLRVILSEAHSAAMKRRGDGSGPAAAARALVACLGDAYGPGRPGAGRGAEAAALCVAGVVTAAEAGYAEGGGVSTRLADDDDDDEDDPRKMTRSAARRTPLGVDDEAAVRDALVDAVLAPPASGGKGEREQHEWLGELGERVAEYWNARGPPVNPVNPVKPVNPVNPVNPVKPDDDDGWGDDDDDWGDDDGWGDDAAKEDPPDRTRRVPTDARRGKRPTTDPEDFELAALRLEANDRVGAFLRRVGELAHGRGEAAKRSAGSLLGDGDGAHEPLVRELVARIGAGADDEGVGADLFHAPSSLGGLLRGGVGAAMGRLGFKSAVVAKPKPSDHPRVVVFVVGGVTPAEVREVASIAEDVRAAFESGASRQSGVKVEDVCVGGTGLLAGDRDLLRVVCE